MILSSTLDPYCGPAPTLENALSSWNFDPFIIACIAGGAAALSCATQRPRPWQTALLVILLVVAFVSPLCAMTSALFSVRLAHHIFLGSIVAPLIAIMWFSEKQWIGKIPSEAVFLIHTAIYWVWHLPFGYAFAMSGTWQYWLMQIGLIAASILLWRALFSRETSIVVATGLALGTMVQMGFLGAILTFAPTPLFDAHVATTQAFGLTQLVDQQLAGVLMWTLGFAPYAIVILWCIGTRLLFSRPLEQ